MDYTAVFPKFGDFKMGRLQSPKMAGEFWEFIYIIYLRKFIWLNN